jgi:hypothetical protein
LHRLEQRQGEKDVHHAPKLRNRSASRDYVPVTTP